MPWQTSPQEFRLVHRECKTLKTVDFSFFCGWQAKKWQVDMTLRYLQWEYDTLSTIDQSWRMKTNFTIFSTTVASYNKDLALVSFFWKKGFKSDNTAHSRDHTLRWLKSLTDHLFIRDIDNEQTARKLNIMSRSHSQTVIQLNCSILLFYKCTGDNAIVIVFRLMAQQWCKVKHFLVFGLWKWSCKPLCYLNKHYFI